VHVRWKRDSLKEHKVDEPQNVVRDRARARPLLEAAYLFVLVALAAVLFAARLGNEPLWKAQEARSALIARTMLAKGDFIAPWLPTGRVSTQKPPLFYWLVAASMQLPVKTEMQVRLPSALAAVGTLIVTFLLGRRLYGALGGFVAGLALATTYLFWHLARSGTVDMLLTFWVALAFLLFVEARFASPGRRKRKALFVCFYVACSLGALTKGPVALALVGLPLAVYLGGRAVAEKSLAPFKGLHPLLGVGVLLVITVPWFAAIGFRTNGAFLRTFFGRHNLARLATAAGCARTKPFWYYLKGITWLTFPWIAFLPAALWRACRPGGGSTRPGRLLPVAWLLAGVVMLSCVAYKHNTWLLPCLPGLALAVGGVLGIPRARGVRPDTRQSVHNGWGLGLAGMIVLAVAMIGCAGFAAACAGAIPVPLSAPAWLAKAIRFGRQAIADYVGGGKPVVVLMAVVLAVSSLAALAVFLAGRTAAAALMVAFMAGSTYLVYSSNIAPQMAREGSLEGFAAKCRQVVRAEDALLLWRYEAHQFLFYMDREAVLALEEEDSYVPTPSGMPTQVLREEMERARNLGGRLFVLSKDAEFANMAAAAREAEAITQPVHHTGPETVEDLQMGLYYVMTPADR